MTQKTIKTFVNEIYSKPLKQNYPTNKTDVYHIDVIWSLDTIDLKDYGPENYRGYRYVSLVFDTFPKFGFKVPLKNKNPETKKRLLPKYSYKFLKKTRFNRDSLR